MADEFAVAGSLHGDFVLFEAARHKLPDFVEPAGDDLFVDAAFDALDEVWPVSLKSEDEIAGLTGLRLEVADGLAGRVENFERADESARIVPVNRRGGFGVEAFEFSK